MGLSICVGILADLLEFDPEGASHIRAELDLIAEEMTLLGLSQHQEPEFCGVWTADALGYRGIHALCEVLGHAHAGQEIPRDNVLDGVNTPMTEAVMAEIWNQMEAGGEQSVPFAHLLLHTESDGYYLPQDFDPPFFRRAQRKSSAKFLLALQRD